MGRVRTKLVKKAARVIIEKYYPRLTLDFDTNKKVADEVAQIPTKRCRNKIAGFVTHLMKRISRGGSVRGISLKLQEEERERRMDFVPDKSVLDVETVGVDADTIDMLRSIEFPDLSGLVVQAVEHGHGSQPGQFRRERQQGERRERGERGERGGEGGGKDRRERREKGEKKTEAAPATAPAATPAATATTQ